MLHGATMQEDKTTPFCNIRRIIHRNDLAVLVPSIFISFIPFPFPLSLYPLHHTCIFVHLSLSHTHTQRYNLDLFLSNRNASQGQILDELISKLRRDIAPLLAIADAVALLDMLHSFAHHVSLSDRFVRPEFGTGCQPLTT